MLICNSVELLNIFFVSLHSIINSFIHSKEKTEACATMTLTNDGVYFVNNIASVDFY